MEILGLIDLPGWLLGIFVCVISICLYTHYKQSFFKRLGIPTKPTVFFFGDIFEAAKKGIGYIDEDMVRRNGKVFGLYLGNIPTLVISDPDMIKQIMVKDFSKFADRAKLAPLTDRWKSAVTFADGDHWRFLRATLSPTFTSGKIREMGPLIHKCMDTLHEIMDETIQKNPDGFDVEPILSGYTLDVICRTGFGMDIDAQRDHENQFIKYSKEFLEFKGTKHFVFMFYLFFPDLIKLLNIKTSLVSNEAFDFFMATLRKAFQERKQEHSKHRDLLQLLINAHKGDFGVAKDESEGNTLNIEEMKKRGLTDEEVLINSIMFMLGGYDTTATVLAWIIYELVNNPDCQDKLIQEIDEMIGDTRPTYDNVFKLPYLDMVVNETLRMHPPSNRLNREALEDVEINGVQIKKGMDCTFSTEALHYMPEYWEEPKKFMPERFAPENKDQINEYAYMPFGQGPRHCVGKRLALLEVKATVVCLLQKYRFHITDKLKVPMMRKNVGLGKPEGPVFVKVETLRKD